MKQAKVAIHEREYSFSKRWIEYCQENSIPYEIVNCYDSDIISQLRSSGCNVLLWHWNHTSAEDVLVAKHVLKGAEMLGMTVFPNVETFWSFDDKVSQKYILEAVDAPLVPCKVFLSKESALDWINTVAKFPQVFKLSKGAASKNVRLVRNQSQAKTFVKQAFGSGFKPMGRYIRDLGAVFERSSWQKRLNLLSKVKKIPKAIYDSYLIDKRMGRESGYIYFQEFIPENKFDTRITVIHGKYAFGFTRNVRKNDFRASGSGSIDYSLDRIDMRCVEIGITVARKLKVQSIAFDFVFDEKQTPLIIEVSYGFDPRAIPKCTGFWDAELNWHQRKFYAEDFIIAGIIEQLRSYELGVS
ncbi:MAG: hypothetical protein KAS96_03065 [Planctomycetes bacterium]|nr:hypothetical protein [Planctomycetota bacterium]